MHTRSSAKRTCSASRSAVENTATVGTPRACAARMMRTAISPRLATRIFWNIEPSRRVKLLARFADLKARGGSRCCPLSAHDGALKGRGEAGIGPIAGEKEIWNRGASTGSAALLFGRGGEGRVRLLDD